MLALPDHLLREPEVQGYMEQAAVNMVRAAFGRELSFVSGQG